MGSYSFLNKKPSFRKSGSSAGSDKEMNGKLKRSKIRRPVKMNEYGMKRLPDYTELAYKEAVSKLRYFLSGNSAPSVRSYGGSASIKNLEESDGDLEKKYPMCFNTLSEYKPRPRLTAKYATLYADSLNNYTPPQPTLTTAPPAASNDLTGGANPDVINFIQKQEEYIEQLERESQYCRDELNNLLGKVKEVISENEHLHDAQKNKIISRMFHTYNAGSETDDLDDVGDSTGLDSDNKASPTKSRRPKSRSTKLEGPNIVFESRIAELEAQLTQAKIDLKKVQDENNENKRKLANGLVDSTCLDGFKRQIDNLQRDKTTLESQIAKLKLSLEQRDGVGENRYKHGSDAVEQQLREERNNLELEIRRLKDDLAKERSKVRELAGEGARRAIQERSAAEQRYNAHFDELQHDLAAQYDNVAKLQLDLERQRREENELKRELSMKNAAVEELKMELKNKCASLQADLAQAYAEKASLEEELASARLAMERQQRQSKHETNRLNSEIQSLRQRLDRADADLVHSRRENLRLSEQISNLEKELNMKSLTPISPEKNKKEKELSTMVESIENKHAKTVAELESMIQSQNSLMEKLSSECRLLTNKLDDANRRHKQELATLQRQVEGLGRSLQSTYSHQPSNYKAPSSHTAAASGISHSPPSTGQHHSRSESPGDTALRQNSDIVRDNIGNYETGDVNSQQVNDRNIDNQNYVSEEPHEQQIYDTEMSHDQQIYDITQDQGNYKNLDNVSQHYKTNIEEHNPDNNETSETNKNPNNEPNYVTKKVSEQNSRESVDYSGQKLSKQSSREKISPNHTPTEVTEPNAIEKTVNLAENTNIHNDEQLREQVENINVTEKPIEEPTEQYEQHYDQNYEQNYEQNFEQQQYEEPQYSQQYENYEQYPQQYDPNTQYEQYPEGYTEQTYDNTEYNQEYEAEYPQNAPESQSTNEKLSNQS